MKIPYFDCAATTPVDPRVIEAMLPLMGPDGAFGNPASTHSYGVAASMAVGASREAIAELLHAEPREIIFTSGATESDNLALKGVAAGHPGMHIVTTAIEHRAVLDPAAVLEAAGHPVTRVLPAADGHVDVEGIAAALRPDTGLVSVMHANNETGAINDVAAIAALCHARGVVFHSDAAQSFGKLALDVRSVPVDLLSFTAHKIYGPKGIGALYVRRRGGPRLVAQMHGGGHEHGLRSGTLASHEIVGFGAACELMAQEHNAENERLVALRDRLWAGVAAVGGVQRNGTDLVLPGHLNITVDGVSGELLLRAVSSAMAVSSGSACNAASVEPSHVLIAMGRTPLQARASLRFSLGRFNTMAEVEGAVARFADIVTRLRS
ncbi:MAG: cysteine desulfurase [Nevskiaceae bacterium]|nr:MAG: cysteine desulfurase [Nevskiaceae bacterium]TBR73991.1 MAG: cysteine desulfurase [Nevskiaceae bacterium]